MTSPLLQDLERLQATLTALRRDHDVEISRTSVAGTTPHCHLDFNLACVEESLADAIDVTRESLGLKENAAPIRDENAEHRLSAVHYGITTGPV